jgi:hypothetical protein
MNFKKKKHVKKQTDKSKQKVKNGSTLTVQDQLEMFAKIIVDIYFENLQKNSNEEKSSGDASTKSPYQTIYH